VPVGLAVAGANRNDHLLLAETLAASVVPRPRPTKAKPQGLCLDKGYDYASTRTVAAQLKLTLHLRTRGEEAQAKRRHPRAKARRWVVERTHSWLNRFRRLLVRWEKKAANYEAMLHLACATITAGQTGLFG
jgi:putative transposase